MTMTIGRRNDTIVLFEGRAAYNTVRGQPRKLPNRKRRRHRSRLLLCARLDFSSGSTDSPARPVAEAAAKARAGYHCQRSAARCKHKRAAAVAVGARGCRPESAYVRSRFGTALSPRCATMVIHTNRMRRACGGPGPVGVRDIDRCDPLAPKGGVRGYFVRAASRRSAHGPFTQSSP